MGYAAIILGLLIGSIWTSLIGALPRHSRLTLRAPVRHFCTFVIARTLSGPAIPGPEFRAFLAGRSANPVSNVLVAGFAVAAKSLAASALSAQFQCSPWRGSSVSSSLRGYESFFA